MEGLSVKVFRTYNASIQMERMLREQVCAAGACVAEQEQMFALSEGICCEKGCVLGRDVS